MTQATAALIDHLYDLNALGAAVSIMDWDQQTFMPRGGASARAEHVGILSRMHHELLVGEKTKRLIGEAASKNGLDDEDLAVIRLARRHFDLSTKIPTELVAEKSRLSALAHEAWVEAKAKSDFDGFAPILERMFEIARQEAEHLGYEDHIYDALLDQYEEGMKAADCRAMYESIRGPQVELVQHIVEKGIEVDDSRLFGDWDIDAQKKFTETIVAAIGFDMTCGRQDVAPHPFCTNFAIQDVRLTTRFKPFLGTSIFGSMHEAGHGMYEQGSPIAWDRTPLAGGVSLGVHESQSRLWENIVGRSRAFWVRFLPMLQEMFPMLADLDVDRFYPMVNKVKPSLIRVEADEVTYNLHTLIRFEIECAVLTGELKVKDMPSAWNDKFQSYLGVVPANDAEGCLQDVHWSMGSIGYFPTYSVGNLLSYQIWATLQKDLGDTDALIEQGEFGPILKWLQDKVYSQGSKYTPKELVMRVTGKPLDATDYLNGLQAKYSDIYGLV